MSLEEEFEAKNLQLTDSWHTESHVLIVQSEVLQYKFQFFTGPPPPSGDIVGLCVIRTQLLHQSSNQIVAEIITVNQIDVGRGMLEPKGPESLLQEFAVPIAFEGEDTSIFIYNRRLRDGSQRRSRDQGKAILLANLLNF